MRDKIEYQVRPVIRYIVTEYREGLRSGGCSVIGEFESEAQAVRVRNLFQATDPGANGWVVVRQTFDVDAQVYYAQSEQEAHERANELSRETGAEWRCYRRSPVADAVAMFWREKTLPADRRESMVRIGLRRLKDEELEPIGPAQG